MRSDAQSVDQYLAETPQERRAALTELRGLCRELLPDHEEGTRWGMTACIMDGETEFALARRRGTSRCS